VFPCTAHKTMVEKAVAAKQQQQQQKQKQKNQTKI
jgi:hypothetical protein